MHGMFHLAQAGAPPTSPSVLVCARARSARTGALLPPATIYLHACPPPGRMSPADGRLAVQASAARRCVRVAMSRPTSRPPDRPDGRSGGGRATEREVLASDYSDYRYPPSRGGREDSDDSSPPNAGGGGPGRPLDGRRPPQDDNSGPFGSTMTRVLMASAFVVGVGAGVFFDTSAYLQPSNVASRLLLDAETPNAETCFANGYSAMAFDQRIYLSLNPFSVYVDQAVIKPGCVMRMSTWKELERRNLVTPDEVASCKKAMNTFAYVGDLDKDPEISCVYLSDDSHNNFLTQQLDKDKATKDEAAKAGIILSSRASPEP